MPYAAFGEKAAFEQRGSEFIRLKDKGDKAHIRFINSPYYNGKHFIKEDEKWTVYPCNRIMNETSCDFCEEYFQAYKELKALKELDDSGKEVKEKEKEVKKLKPKVSFYYPVIDRETQEAKIFDTTLSVRLHIDKEVKNGIDPLNFDYVVTRTEETGNNYYSVVRLDSSQTEALTEKELKAAEVMTTSDIASIVEGKESNQKLEVVDPDVIDKGMQAEKKTVDPNDLPFE